MCTGLLLASALPSQARGAPSANRVAIGMQLEPPILDPTASPAAAISEVLYGNVFEGLVRFAADGSVVPALAASWDISDDGLTYVFHLRHGVRFHDGTAFDADAAKLSLDRARGPASVNPQKARPVGVSQRLSQAVARCRDTHDDIRISACRVLFEILFVTSHQDIHNMYGNAHDRSSPHRPPLPRYAFSRGQPHLRNGTQRLPRSRCALRQAAIR
jgi:hypothetical protein